MLRRACASFSRAVLANLEQTSVSCRSTQVLVGASGTSSPQWREACWGSARGCAATAHTTVEDAPTSFPLISFYQEKRLRNILRLRAKAASKKRWSEIKREVGPDLRLEVRKWASILLGQHDAADPEVVELPGAVFNRFCNPRLLHLVVKWQLAKRRAGTHSTKTRAEVRGGGRKPYNQKGTGRARQGSIRAPQWRGGGIVHGPKPRDHSFKVNRQVRRAALKAALSAKVKAGQLIVVDKMLLHEGEAEQLLAQRLAEHEDVLANLNTHKVKHPGLGLRAWLIDVLEGAVPPSTEPVVEGIINQLKSVGVPLVESQARTAVYKKAIPKLLPPDWDKLPESIEVSNDILRATNRTLDTRLDSQGRSRLDRLEAKRSPKQRVSVLIIDSDKEGEDGGRLLRRGVSNLPLVDALPVVGANVYDILRHEYLVMTAPAVEAMVERLTRPINRGFKPLGYDIKAWAREQEAKKLEQAERAKALPDWLEAQKARRRAHASPDALG